MTNPNRCPECGLVEAPEECDACRLFRCTTCGVWRHWDDGNEDGQECSECWFKRTGGAEVDNAEP